MKQITSKVLAASAVLVAAALLALPAASSAQEWHWGVTPYLWMPGVGLESKINDTQLFNTRVKLSDLASKTDFMSAIHLEGQRGTFGLILDVNYMNLGNSNNKDFVTVNPTSANPVSFSTHTDLKETFGEVAGVWSPGGKFEGFGLIYGARIIDFAQRTDVEAHYANGSTVLRTYRLSPTLVDGMLGFRYMARLGQRGSFNLRGDVAAGGTELTYNGLAGFGYSFDDEDRYTLLVGYRYMNMNLKEKSQLETSMAMDGAYVAFRFGF